MQKKHGITVALASLSAATASIVSGALVSQHAVADADAPPKATVTVVHGTTDGSGAYSCTFDDLALPEPGSAVGQGTGATAVGGGAGEPAFVRGHLEVRSDGASAAIASAGGTFGMSVTAEDGPEGPGVPPVRVDLGEAREGTPEECAAVRADLPGAVASAVPTDPVAKADGN